MTTIQKEKIETEQFCTDLIKSKIIKKIKRAIKEEVNKIKILTKNSVLNITENTENIKSLENFNNIINNILSKNHSEIDSELTKTKLDLYLIRQVSKCISLNMSDIIEEITYGFSNNNGNQRCKKFIGIITSNKPVKNISSLQIKITAIINDYKNKLEKNPLIYFEGITNATNHQTQYFFKSPKYSSNQKPKPKFTHVTFQEGGKTKKTIKKTKKRTMKKTKRRNMKKGKKRSTRKH